MIREMTSLVDLPPTLLDAAGLEVPQAMQGRSIMPLVRKQPAIPRTKSSHGYAKRSPRSVRYANTPKNHLKRTLSRASVHRRTSRHQKHEEDGHDAWNITQWVLWVGWHASS